MKIRQAKHRRAVRREHAPTHQAVFIRFVGHQMVDNPREREKYRLYAESVEAFIRRRNLEDVTA